MNSKNLKFSQEVLKNKLTDIQYKVTQNAYTERPFTGEYNKHYPKQGFYSCIVCDTKLFEADSKFDSGCGWPAFFQGLKNNILEKKDTSHGMTRVEVLCKICNAHLGHVFNDGPKPTGIRYCINSASLKYHDNQLYQKFIMSLDKKSQTFKVLIDNAPVGSLIEVTNYIQVFYKFEKDAEVNREPIMEYHQKFNSLVQDNHKYFFITKDNLLQHVEGFQYEFYEVEYDFEKKTKTPVILTVDISTLKVLKKEKIEQGTLPDIYKCLHSQYIDSFELYQHLLNRFAQENFIKHFFIKEKNGVLVFFYTIKNYKKKNFEQIKKKIRIKLQLIITFSFYGFLQSDTGQKFSHKKIFREVKTLKDTQTFLSHLQEIENIYIDILIQALISQNSILHNIRLEKPIIQSSFSWDIFGNYKIKLMDEIHKEGLNVDHHDAS